MKHESNQGPQQNRPQPPPAPPVPTVVSRHPVAQSAAARGRKRLQIEELQRHRFYPRQRRDGGLDIVPSTVGAWVDYGFAKKLLLRMQVAERKLDEIVDVVSAIAAGDMSPESMLELAQRAVTEGEDEP